MSIAEGMLNRVSECLEAVIHLRWRRIEERSLCCNSGILHAHQSSGGHAFTVYHCTGTRSVNALLIRTERFHRCPSRGAWYTRTKHDATASGRIVNKPPILDGQVLISLDVLARIHHVIRMGRDLTVCGSAQTVAPLDIPLVGPQSSFVS